MIIFYPRDIGLWRDEFNFNPLVRPSVEFNDVEALKTFCANHGIRMDDKDWPFKLTDDGYVVQWTVIDYWKPKPTMASGGIA